MGPPLELVAVPSCPTGILYSEGWFGGRVPGFDRAATLRAGTTRRVLCATVGDVRDGIRADY